MKIILDIFSSWTPLSKLNVTMKRFTWFHQIRLWKSRNDPSFLNSCAEWKSLFLLQSQKLFHVEVQWVLIIKELIHVHFWSLSYFKSQSSKMKHRRPRRVFYYVKLTMLRRIVCILLKPVSTLSRSCTISFFRCCYTIILFYVESSRSGVGLYGKAVDSQNLMTPGATK